jgi:pyridoxamine 5'-phosphate oxidase
MIEPLRSILQSALSAEFPGRPWIASLATTDSLGHPHVRHVVIRRVDPDGLWITADTRSAKIEHLSRGHRAELAFWLPSRREQFRVAGVAHVHAGEAPSSHRNSLWHSLTDQSRAMFHWPAPGAPRADAGALFPATLAPDAPVPITFAAVQLVPDEVEHLELAHQPHRRQRWRAADAWHEHAVNP